MSNTRFASKRTRLKSIPLVAGLGLLIIAAQLMWAQTETVLYSFAEMTDGAYPYDSLVRDAKGNLYGTTNGGGTYYWGTVFEVTKKGTGKLLYQLYRWHRRRPADRGFGPGQAGQPLWHHPFWRHFP